MATHEKPRSDPPETLEGWYALHQLFTVDRDLRSRESDSRSTVQRHESNRPASHTRTPVGRRGRA